MKTGIAQIVAIGIKCPYCDADQANNRNYAFMFTDEDLDTLQSPTMECSNCGEKFKIPALAKKF